MLAYKGVDTYRQTQVQSRTPLELVVMLYDGALTSLGAARDAIERRDIPARRDALSRAFAIISELQSTLDVDDGGPIAASLDDLYAYASTRLLDAAKTNDVTPVNEIRRVFEILADAWRTVAVRPSLGAGIGA